MDFWIELPILSTMSFFVFFEKLNYIECVFLECMCVARGLDLCVCACACACVCVFQGNIPVFLDRC